MVWSGESIAVVDSESRLPVLSTVVGTWLQAEPVNLQVQEVEGMFKIHTGVGTCISTQQTGAYTPAYVAWTVRRAI